MGTRPTVSAAARLPFFWQISLQSSSFPPPPSSPAPSPPQSPSAHQDSHPKVSYAKLTLWATPPKNQFGPLTK